MTPDPVAGVRSPPGGAGPGTPGAGGPQVTGDPVAGVRSHPGEEQEAKCEVGLQEYGKQEASMSL